MSEPGAVQDQADETGGAVEERVGGGVRWCTEGESHQGKLGKKFPPQVRVKLVIWILRSCLHKSVDTRRESAAT